MKTPAPCDVTRWAMRFAALPAPKDVAELPSLSKVRSTMALAPDVGIAPITPLAMLSGGPKPYDANADTAIS